MNYPLKPMLPTRVSTIPETDEWVYEIKYDGYRGQLVKRHGQKPQLYSRNLTNLSGVFPEIIHAATENDLMSTTNDNLVLDGEICILTSPKRADFHATQRRGRLKNQSSIEQAADEMPAVFMTFDVLLAGGEDLRFQPLKERRHVLETSLKCNNQIKLIKQENNYVHMWKAIEHSRGEGIVAKKSHSLWHEGKRTEEWLKIKNEASAVFIITGYDTSNGFFRIGLLKGDQIIEVGTFNHGLSPEERDALLQVVKANISYKQNNILYIKPGICVELAFLDWEKRELRQPRFLQFRFDVDWEDCMWDKVKTKWSISADKSSP